MQSSTLTSPTFKKDGLTIVDVDVHAHETPAALAPYCEMPWRWRAPITAGWWRSG
jgi:hypothetical protein